MDELSQWLLERAADGDLDERSQDVVLGALAGDGALDVALSGDTAKAVGERDVESAEPARAFLKSIRVSGFRGIGPAATLSLKPTPGLVVIAGRNGSGKSSFAEALEVALTGDSYRWHGRAKQWANQWRNLHNYTETSIAVEIVEEGSGVTTITADWPATGEMDSRSSVVTRAGVKSAGLGALGWAAPLETCRPLLSYEELGSILEVTPSALHDAIEKILGLGQLNDTLRRLDARVKSLGESRRTAAQLRVQVRDLVAGSSDERAAAAYALLRKSAPDQARLRALIAGAAASDNSAVGFLRAVGELSLPTSSEIAAATRELTDARVAEADAVAALEAQSGANVDLLGDALNHFERHGDESCPVCGVGQLNEAWASRARTVMADAQAALSRRRETRQRRSTARAALMAMVRPAPPALRTAPVRLAAIVTLTSAWSRWIAVPSDDDALAAHVMSTLPDLQDALGKCQAEAAADLVSRDDEWGQLVPQIAGWLQAADQADRDASDLAPVESAHQWLKSNAAELRNLRLQPLADKARKIWAQLRQESNVDLGRISLEGSATRRRVDLTAEVDGTETGALSVMSQGELHALALALFIPRATSSDSPFRFLVLDDPIQAMDPAKVDGFVHVLSDLATTHQVIVLSHDDRLPTAIRRMSVDARVLEVVRSPGSAITIRSLIDPATRYLQDAWALAKDDGASAKAKSDVIPVLCRLAVEAACRDAFYAIRLTAGDSRDAVEAVWQSSPRTRARIALGLFGKDESIDAWLNAKPWRRKALTVVTKAAHEGLVGSPLNAIEDVERVVKELV